LKKFYSIILCFLSSFVLFSLIACSSLINDKTVANVQQLNGYIILTQDFIDINPQRGTNIEIKYPQISNFYDEKREKVINELIKNSSIYSFYNYGSTKDSTVFIDYEVMLATEHIISVKFEGYSYFMGGKNNNRWVYAVNINLNNGEKIILEELFSNSLYSNHNNIFTYKYDWQKDEEGTIAYEIAMSSNATIAELFIEYEKYYSFPYHHDDFYITESKLGLIVKSSPAMGDYLEFLASFEKLRDLINCENAIWENLM